MPKLSEKQRTIKEILSIVKTLEYRKASMLAGSREYYYTQNEIDELMELIRGIESYRYLNPPRKIRKVTK